MSHPLSDIIYPATDVPGDFLDTFLPGSDSGEPEEDD